MPALKLTKFEAEVVWLGQVADSETDLSAQALEQMGLKFGGSDGECHSGLTRPSCSRVSHMHPRGTEIANVRQLSVVSEEELAQIAATMGLDALNPAWVGASMVLRGIPDFTHVPPSSRLQGADGVSLVIDMENRPCVLPGRVIEGVKPGFGKAFKGAAQHRRGVTAWVEREGGVALGDRLRLAVPDQPIWSQIETARAG